MTTHLEAVHLLVDSPGRIGSPDRPANEPDVIALERITSLVASDQQLTPSAGQRPDEIVFEPIHALDQRLVIIVVPDNIEVRVNGLPAAPTSVLSVKDVVEISGGKFVLHVSLYHQPYVGPALQEHTGRECPVCLMGISSDSKVLVCVRCGAVLHDGAIADGGTATEGGEDTDSLQCAKLVTHCPCCSHCLARTEGYVYVPAV